MKVLDLDLLLPKDAEIIWQGKTWFLPADLPSKQALVVISLQEELTRGKISAYREVIKLYTELLVRFRWRSNDIAFLWSLFDELDWTHSSII